MVGVRDRQEGIALRSDLVGQRAYNTNMEKSKQNPVEKLKQGDKSAFEQFYRKTYPRLLAFIVGRVGRRKDGEELAHDTYLSFLDSLPLFQGNSTITTFLYAIARHEVADYFRKRYAKKAILTVPFVDQLYTEKLYNAALLNSELERVFANLSHDQVVILRLKYEEGMPVLAIAKMLSLSMKAAEAKLWRARKAFQAVYLNLYG